MRVGGEIVNLNAFILRQSCPYLMRYETETCFHPKLFPVNSLQYTRNTLQVSLKLI